MAKAKAIVPRTEITRPPKKRSKKGAGGQAATHPGTKLASTPLKRKAASSNKWNQDKTRVAHPSPVDGYRSVAPPASTAKRAPRKKARPAPKPVPAAPAVVVSDGSKIPVTVARPARGAPAVRSNWEALKARVAPPSTAGRKRTRTASPAPDSAEEAELGSRQAKRAAFTVPTNNGRPLPRSDSRAATHVVALDCEMVGVGPGGVASALARVTLVNEAGHVLLDRYVRPLQPVTDFRTAVSGIRPGHIAQAPSLNEVQGEVADVLKGRVVVGHALKNDFKALLLSHPKKDIRDTSLFRPFKNRTIIGGKARTQQLKVLAKEHLSLSIQDGVHCPIDDARAALYLYLAYQKAWEQSLGGGPKPGMAGMVLPRSDGALAVAGGSKRGGG